MTSKRPSIFESPWYWAYAFVTAAIVILLFNQQRIMTRQAQIENKYQGRQRAVRQLSGEATDTPMSTPDDTLISLAPIFGTLGVLFFVTGFGVWRQLRRNREVGSDEHHDPAAPPSVANSKPAG